MSSSVFPTLAGLAFPVLKSPIWNTIQQRVASGREVRVGMMSYPLYNFALNFELLRSATINGTAFTELQTLMNFYNARNGARDDFLFDDPDDDTAAAQFFGTGDGVTTAFQLLRAQIASGFVEPVANLNAVPTILDNGVTVNPANYSVGATGIVTFNVAPTLAHTLTWSGTYYYRCRFSMDEQEFEKFMTSRWAAKTLRMVGSLGTKV